MKDISSLLHLRRNANFVRAFEFVCFFVEISQNCFKYPLNLFDNQRTNGPVKAHLISWPSKAQNIQNLENIW